MKVKPIVAGIFALVGVAGSLALAGPAQAHSSCHSVDGRGQGCVSDGHHWGYVEDWKADNWGVRIHLWNNLGQHFVVGDANGSKDGVSGRQTVGSNEVYTKYQVCAGENGADTVCGSVYSA